ncbi:MAG: DUF1297 domain-containing protein [Candidatus Gracilibacteria bacterium]|nr:DUF1297 domain-containing protein [Candidatus Gracilibacteria bacterium]
MIYKEDIQKTLAAYDTSKITIASLGGHSALDVCEGAKKLGFRTLVIARKGREKTYSKYYKTRGAKGCATSFANERGCVDEVIVVNDFSDLINSKVQEKLLRINTILIHSRYFWVYFDFEKVENELKVPIYGTREMLKLEERDVEKNQYYLLQKAGIRIPKLYASPAEIDGMVIVKVNEAARGYERAFFYASSPKDFEKKSQELLKAGTITKEALDKAVIEEFILGAQVNFNYFYSNLTDELELMGTDTRRQTSLDGYLRLPADEQLEVLKIKKPKLIETGHMTCTTKESLLEKAFDIGQKFVDMSKHEVPPGIIGPFALQGAVAAEDGNEEIVIFDVSMRIPGSPGTRFTPYTSYLHGRPVSYGERIAMEIKLAIEEGKLNEVCT